MPAWYVKVHIDSQLIGRYPNRMEALAQGAGRSDTWSDTDALEESMDGLNVSD